MSTLNCSTQRGTMDHIVARNWNRHNRSSRIESILTVLNRSGQSEAKYFKGRSYITALLLGKGHPEEVNESEMWNRVRITYQGKDAIEIFDSKLGPDGRIFTEEFTEDENSQIKSALNDVEIYTWQDYLSRNKLIKPLYVCFVLLGVLIALDNIISGNLIWFFLWLGVSLIHLHLLLRK